MSCKANETPTQAAGGLVGRLCSGTRGLRPPSLEAPKYAPESSAWRM